MIATLSPAQARVVNNCACYFTFSRVKDAGMFWGRVKAHADAANENDLPVPEAEWR